MMRGLVPFAAGVLLCGAIATAASQAPTQPPPGPPPATPPADAAAADWVPPAPKNLKVLPKDIEPKQLLAVMRGFTQAMGVRCVYCHVAGPDPSDMSSYNFESDRKEHKETTRAMLKYTDAVNESFPKGVGEEPKAGELRVTCYTCHQGQREPPTRKPDGPARTGAPAAPQGQAPRPPGN
jgi:hypothetical protein